MSAKELLGLGFRIKSSDSERFSKTALTDAHKEEEDEEDVEHGRQRQREGRDDLAQRLDAAEEADDAEGTQDAYDAGGLVGDNERHDRHGDDEGVEQAPSVLDEGLEPVGEHVDRKLYCEEERKEEVELVEDVRELCRRAIWIDKVVYKLRLSDSAAEVLKTQNMNNYESGFLY